MSAEGKEKKEAAPAQVLSGCRVQLMGLQAKPELNGQFGTAETLDPDSGRWVVRLNKGQCLKIKPANLLPQVFDEDDEEDEGLQQVMIDGKMMTVNPARLKKEFEAVNRKYSLNLNNRGAAIADYLTDTSARSQVSVDEFAAKFGLERDDALSYMMYINLMVSFKEQWMDPKELGL